MAQELLDYRKGKTEATGELEKLRGDREELSMANLQMQQENRLLHQQLMEMQERQMRPQQMMTAYSGSTSGTIVMPSSPSKTNSTLVSASSSTARTVYLYASPAVPYLQQRETASRSAAPANSQSPHRGPEKVGLRH